MPEQFDVIIVGAGLSGIGSAYQLQQKCPNKSYVILEQRDSIGGTWDIFRYPGIRSDSDMYTLGYGHKPWHGGKVLADGPAIKQYVSETASENNIDKHIRYGLRVTGTAFDRQSATWSVSAEDDSGETKNFTGTMLLMCAGYYSYQRAYTPDFPGLADYRGVFFHPQFWPEGLDYADKSVIVIGSGATAVSVIPAMAKSASKVVMLQRSPTYFWSRDSYDAVGRWLDKVLPKKIAYAITRWKNATVQRVVYGFSRIWPGPLKRHLIEQVRKQLGPDYDVETHFTPHYNPWDERLCALDDNDIYPPIKAGKVEVVTDHIERFTEVGILLKSGRELEADIVVSATGLELVTNGEATLTVDGQPVNLPDIWSYKGMMYSNVPNLINTFGYINASWTLRADMVADFTCRVIHHMDETHSKQVTPCLRASDADMVAKSWIDGFQSGYMQRGLPKFPKQGDREPWLNSQNYSREKRTIGKASVDDGVLTYT